MTEHTLGKVRLLPPFDQDHPGWSILGNNQVVAMMMQGNHEGNARRIVALWNACAGISTADLEAIAANRDFERRLESLAEVAMEASDVCG